MNRSIVALAPLTASVTPKTVVVFHEKQGNRYVSGSAGFLKIARKVFDERDALPDFYEYPRCPPEMVRDPGPRPGPEVADQWHWNWCVRKRDFDLYSQLQVEFELAVRARAGDDAAAAEFLVRRKRREYEGFTVEPLEVLD